MTECSICFENDDCEYYKTRCEHDFHTSCLDSWLKESNTCPICRVLIPIDIEIFPDYIGESLHERELNISVNYSSLFNHEWHPVRIQQIIRRVVRSSPDDILGTIRRLPVDFMAEEITVAVSQNLNVPDEASSENELSDEDFEISDDDFDNFEEYSNLY